ncbi:MAG: PAS domain S-box protein [Desulfobacteraceae bacterium]|nr:PAS domain S-box protein [Desulfobacteraceae bacterium]
MQAIPSEAPTVAGPDPLKTFATLIDRLVLCMSLAGLPAVLIAISRATVFGWRWGVNVQVVAWAFIMLLLVFRRRVSFRRRTYGFLVCLMVYSGAGVMMWGLNGQGLLLLFACVVMATLVDGPRAGLVAACLSLAITGVAGTGFVNGWLSIGPASHSYNRSILAWATGLSTATAVMLAAVWGLGQLKSSWLAIMQTLRAREKEYASILRFSPDVIYRLDEDNRITFISDAVRRYGLDPADMQGRSLLDFVHPEERSTVMHRLQERRTGQRRTQNMEVRMFGRSTPAEAPHGLAPEESAPPVFLINAEGLYEPPPALPDHHIGTQGVARDITEYKQVYRELLEEKNFSEATINSLPGIFYLFTETGCLVRWNRHLEDVTGRSPDDLRERHILDFFHDDMKPSVAEGFREVMYQGSRRIEADVKHENGKVTPFLLSGSAWEMRGRRYMLGMGIDITERKRAETALAESEAFFRDMAANVPGVVYQFYARPNNDYGLYYVSERSGEIFGMTGDLEQYFLLFAERLMPEQRAAFLASIEHAVRTVSPWEFEGEFVKPDGETIWFRGISRPQKHGDEVIFNGILLDVTHQKRTEMALQQSEEKYRFLAESIQDVIWSTDLDFKFTYVSPAVEKMLGWTVAEVQSIGLEGIMPEETLAAFHSMFVRAYADSVAKDDFSNAITREQTLWHKQKTKVWVENTATFLCDNDGQPYGLIGVTRDITQRRQALQEKEELQQKLERARKMEALGLLAGGVAHDLNNVLSGVVSYPSLMLMKLPPDSPLRQNLMKMKSSGEKAAEIVQDLLTLARRGVKAQEVVNINQVIREHLKSADYLHLRAEHPGVRVIAELAPDLLPIEGSPLHLKKALMNLVTNAFEAQPGGGSITVETQNRYIDRSLKGYEDIEKGEFVVLRVADEGPGMEADEVDRIFEPFYSRKKMGRSGTGLGMAVVWGTIQDHQGYIHVKSAPGQGTRFDLYFPVTRREAVMPPSGPQLADLQGNRQTILVIDDDCEQQAIAVEILEALNYRATAVTSGEAALEWLKTQAADLLILDMIMPGGMDGLDTYRAVLKMHPHQNALVVSGFAETARVQEAQRLGARGFVRKPYTVETLAGMIKGALGGVARS